ncbi:hypothetical protein [Streptomyces sindenensis]|uniref:Uncharacterized protein n=1 Tax=Streptomyces sindenensis TaxID=67363 RepID=A0ABW6EQY4_9ACTN
MQPSKADDVRGTVLDPLTLTAEQNDRLHGLKCARCGTVGRLRLAGYAYTTSGNGGRLGWPLRLCPECPGTGA